MNNINKKSKKGKLTIFTSYTPGAGKSYLMVSEAVKEQKRGRKAVIGFLNGRHRDIRKILEDNNLVNVYAEESRDRKMAHNVQAYGDVCKKEEKTDKYRISMTGLLLEKPDLVLLDELGMRGINTEKKTFIYEDAEELLGMGIDVYATANLKKFESANPLFKKVTGIGMKRTIPDRLLENAECIFFVDREPELMLEDFERGSLFGERYMKTKIMQKNFQSDTLEDYREISKKYLKKYGDKVKIVTR